ncbi:MAG: DUF4173 domain-containing protein [Oscillospiraceae bacterium]|nr:DUF4173 domain-containing protein [Oscillospiraceae bacterium]
MENRPDRPAPAHTEPPAHTPPHPVPPNGPAHPGQPHPHGPTAPGPAYHGAAGPAWPTPPPAYVRRVYTYDGADRRMLAGAWLAGFLWLQLLGVSGPPQAGMLLYFLFAHVILFLYTTGRRPAKLSAPCLVLYAALLALALPFLLFSNRLLATFNLLALTGLSVVLFLLLRDGEHTPWDSPRTLLRGALNFFYLPFAHLARPFGAARSLSGSSCKKTVLHVLIGLAVACPLFALALLWLTGADAVFGRFVTISLDWLSATFGLFSMRLFFGALLGLLFYSAAYGIRHGALAAGPRAAAAGRTPPPIIITVLSLFALLYALFCAVQFVYLFGGTTSQLPAGVSGYAQYARAGFFELCYVTGLNLALTLGCLQLSAASRPGLWRTVRALCAVIMGFTAVMLASAAYRMGLYIAVHGLTILRTFTLWGMAVMSVLIVGVLCKALRPRFRFFRLLTATVLIGYAALNFANIDARIASFNVNRFLSGQTEYAYEEYLIFHLSYDALPALEALRDSGYNEIRYSRSYYTPYATLDEAISARRNAAREECADLRSLSLSAHRAAGS